MTASHKLRAFTLLLALVVVGAASSAMAFCSSCGVAAPAYSAGYAPVTYQAAYAPAYTASYAPAYTAAYAPTYTAAYAPVTYTTAYAPAYTTYNSGWYPGRLLGRVNRAIWGQPTTTYYAPAYTAAYAPAYSVGYAPAVAYAQPACSTCSASYAPAPACSTCSACSASYAPAAPACSSCSTCDACSAGVTVTEGVAAAPCANCSASVAPASYTETVVTPAPPSTYNPGATPPANEPTPALPPNLNVAPERTLREADKPAPVADPLELEPKAQPADDSATHLQAPKLFDPSDNTAATRHPAPVWTAVYHRVSGSDTATAQPISYQQAQEDAQGWTSGSN